MSRRYREPGIEVESFTSITDEYAGTHDSWWGVAKVHVKAQDPAYPLLLANELVCSRLAAALGLPVLPGEIAKHTNGRQCWITPQISYDGVTVPPTRESDVMETYAPTIAGMLAFDCWVLNEDRHEENLLFHPKLGVWLIDHDDALAGKDGRRLDSLAKKSNVPLGWHGFQDAELPEESLKYWTWRVQTVPSRAIDLALDEANARGLIRKAEAVSIGKVLRSRQEHIVPLVNQFVGRSIDIGPGEQAGLFET